VIRQIAQRYFLIARGFDKLSHRAQYTSIDLFALVFKPCVNKTHRKGAEVAEKNAEKRLIKPSSHSSPNVLCASV